MKFLHLGGISHEEERSEYHKYEFVNDTLDHRASQNPFVLPCVVLSCSVMSNSLQPHER